MKYKKQLITGMLLFALIIFASCSNSLEYTNIDNKQNEESIDEHEELLDVYFYNTVKNNPIDEIFEKEFDEGNRTYTEIVNSYTLMWIDEFNYTKSQCDEFIIDEEERAHLITLLDEWHNNERATWNSEFRFLFNESRFKYGTQAYDEEWKKLGDRYREKTLWLKYCFL